MHAAISVVIPVFNNGDTVERVYQQLRDVLGEFRFEVIFVDDASADDSLEALCRLSGQDARVAVVALAHNVGQNQAIVYGLREARGNIIAIMDADLQDPVRALPHLVSHLASTDAAVVFAGRRGRYSSVRRWLTSRGFKLLLSTLSRFRLPTDAGLFLVMRRHTADTLLAHYRPYGYILSYITKAPGRFDSTPVSRYESARSNYTSSMRLKLAWRAVQDMIGFPRLAKESPPPAIQHIGHRFESPLAKERSL